MNQMSGKPYYAVIFSSKHTGADSEYDEIARRMADLAQKQPGFISIESARDKDGFGITVSYWSSVESILEWKSHSEHAVAQNVGKEKWYQAFTVRICKVEREYAFEK